MEFCWRVEVWSDMKEARMEDLNTETTKDELAASDREKQEMLHEVEVGKRGRGRAQKITKEGNSESKE